MNERPVKKPRPAPRPPEPRIVHPPPEHDGVLEQLVRPAEIGWG